jgi:hypothetical protein
LAESGRETAALATVRMIPIAIVKKAPKGRSREVSLGEDSEFELGMGLKIV